MERAEFVNKVAKMLGTNQELAEIAVNATLAELAAPRIWGTQVDLASIFGDNNCNNNCKEQAALTAPVLSRKS